MHNGDIFDFAILASSGQVVDIRAVPRGLACGCLCPQCRRPLVAKKGRRNRHHFSHLATAQPQQKCSGGPETALHLAAKQIISRWKHLMLPALVVTECSVTSDGEILEGSESIEVDFFPISNCQLPDEGGWVGDWRPDVVLFGPKGELRVEIKVHNGISSEKHRKIQRDRIPAIEFDLTTPVFADGWNLTTLEQALRSDTTLMEWVFHPEQEALRERVRESLGKKQRKTLENLIEGSPVFGGGALVFHPWLGLVPADPDERYELLSTQFLQEEILHFPGTVMNIRQHALMNDSCMISFHDQNRRATNTGTYDAIFSEFLGVKKYRSIFIGSSRTRILRGMESIESIREFQDYCTNSFGSKFEPCSH